MMIKRNNPGNIRPSKRYQWKGEIRQTSQAFCQFSELKYGCRAMLLLLRNYMRLHNLCTIPQIINRWAPPSENHTAQYVQIVCSTLGLSPLEELSPDKETLIALAKAMTLVEQGRGHRIDEMIWQKAYNLLP